jgi:hypothetical protein
LSRASRFAATAQAIVGLAKQIVTYIWKWVIALGVLSSIAASLYLRVLVTPLTSLQPSNPFSTPFLLTNDGYLSIHAVEFSCGLNDVITKNYWKFEGFLTQPQQSPTTHA